MKTPILLAGAVLVILGGPAAAAAPDAQGALAAAKRLSSCGYCDFDYAYGSHGRSASRGLVAINASDPGGGGAVMIMAYSGSRWDVLWEGNGSTQNLDKLPGKTRICMDAGGWTNLRNGPGLDYRRIGKLSEPTVKKVFEARLAKAVGRRTPGEAWFRISHNGRPAWVQNLRTIVSWPGSPQTCADWARYYR